MTSLFLGGRTYAAVILCLFCFQIFKSQATMNVSPVKRLTGNCAYDIVYRKLFDVTVYKCVTECKRRSRCHHILYKEEMNYCGLIEDTAINVDQDDNVAQCSYVNVDAIDFSVSGPSLGECINTPCGITQRCSINGTSYQCEESECLAAPPLLNGTLLSDVVAVGDRTTYHCEWPLVLDGPAKLYITCMHNGEWSDAGLTCAKTCRKRNPRVVNAVLTYSSNPRMTVGTTLRYDCVDGYKAVSTYDTMQCGPDGRWSRLYMRCCRSGYELYFSYCVKLKFTNSTSNTITGMRSSCRAEGSDMYAFNLNMARFMIKKHAARVANVAFNTTEDNYKLHLTTEDKRCLETVSGLSYTSELSTMDLSRLLQFARTSQPPCLFASSWYSRYPSQQTSSSERCLFTGNATNFLLADIACDSFAAKFGFVCSEVHSTKQTKH